MGENSLKETKRSCTDIVWLLIFILFWAGMAIIAWQGIISGDPRSLVAPSNSEGSNCGINNSKSNSSAPDLSSEPYLYYINPFDANSPKVCVDKCPESSIAVTTVAQAICKANYVPANISDLIANQNDGNCAWYLYQSTPVLFRCSPSNLQALFNISGQTNSTASQIITDDLDLSVKIVGDFSRSWWFFLAFAGGALVLSFIWVLLLRFIAGFFVWTMVFLSALSLDGLAVFFYFAWTDAKNANDTAGYVTSGMQREEHTYFGMFIAAIVVAVLMQLILIALRKRIKIAISVIKESSKAIKAMPSMVFFPVLVFILMLIVFSYWVIIELYLASGNKDPVIAGKTYNIEILQYFQWYHLFGLFWTQQFLSGINQVTIAGAVSTWYWSKDKRAIGGSPTLSSFGRALRYNLGSIALGSLFIAIIQFIRSILFYIEQTLKGTQNRITKTLLACCQCCFCCVEKVFKFINKNAYIEIAMNGTPFCKSAKNAFQILVRNAFRLVAIDFVSTFILFLSKLTISCFTGVGSYYAIKYYFTDEPLYYPAATIFVIMLLSYVVASVFLYTYAMTIDTIFLSFCEDCENNDGSAARPYYMSPELQNIANVKNVMIERNQVRPESAEEIIQTREAFVEDI